MRTVNAANDGNESFQADFKDKKKTNLLSLAFSSHELKTKNKTFLLLG